MTTDLKKSLTFFHVIELRELALRLALCDKGSKMTLIMRIMHYLQTGQKLTLPKFPEQSCAKRGSAYLLSENELMLYPRNFKI